MKIIRGAALCEACDRWLCVPRVLQGGDRSPRPAACWVCGGRTRHRRRCILAAIDNSATLPEGPGPEKSGA